MELRREVTKKMNAWYKDLRRFGKDSERGSTDSSGTVGARGRLTHVSGRRAPRRIGASIIPEGGSNTFQGRLTDITCVWSEERGTEYIVTASFDSRTGSRLKEKVCGNRGNDVMDDAEYSLTIIQEEPPGTSRST